MGLLDKKVTEGLLGTGVSSAPDRLIGTAADNKAVFDRLIRAVVAGSINPLIDELAGAGGAAAIGAQVEGTTETISVQAVLDGLRERLEKRYTKEQVDAALTEATGKLLEAVELDRDGIWTFTARDGSKLAVDSKLGALTLFEEAARRAEEAAEKAKREADRATQVAGGDFATRSEMENKADKALLFVEGNLAEMDKGGGLRDSGAKIADYATKQEMATRAPVAWQEELLLSAALWTGERRPFYQEVALVRRGTAGIACISTSATREHWSVCRQVGLRLERETETGILFAADAGRPSCDLPVTILFVGGGE